MNRNVDIIFSMGCERIDGLFDFQQDISNLKHRANMDPWQTPRASRKLRDAIPILESRLKIVPTSDCHPIGRNFSGRALKRKTILDLLIWQLGRRTSSATKTTAPIGFAGGDTNLYSYVGQNPINFIDPDGRNAVAPVVFAGTVLLSPVVVFQTAKYMNSISDPFKQLEKEIKNQQQLPQQCPIKPDSKRSIPPIFNLPAASET